MRSFQTVVDAFALPRRRHQDGMAHAGLIHHGAEFLVGQRLGQMRGATGHPRPIRRFEQPDVNPESMIIVIFSPRYFRSPAAHSLFADAASAIGSPC